MAVEETVDGVAVADVVVPAERRRRRCVELYNLRESGTAC